MLLELNGAVRKKLELASLEPLERVTKSLERVSLESFERVTKMFERESFEHVSLYREIKKKKKHCY